MIFCSRCNLYRNTKCQHEGTITSPTQNTSSRYCTLHDQRIQEELPVKNAIRSSME
jgi:hypothetical protein